ncbi:hypothetical protein [Rhizobium leguminosarum]|uniref:hypothetical protein n=1 Tax=Rhizobium leguminosarum TaxID=384 RepID=UPI00103A47E6|nr:hypothetical protein [Rhizobium leguminosarum]TBZ22538.1 hypothetical protein E0H38_11410 [Rhizobium leguminosarum bv. viciae]
MRAVLNRIFFTTASIISLSSVASAVTLPENWKQPAAEVVVWFETSGTSSWGSVTPDFDYQGMSAGAFQWNIGKGSLRDNILKDISKSVFEASMPVYGKKFHTALHDTTNVALEYVRGFQTFRRPDLCKKGRGAEWTNDGKVFSQEISALMATKEVKAKQQKRIDADVKAGWEYASWWARAKRGPEASPTFVEVLFFTDTLNFNGEWKQLANYEKVKSFKGGRSNKEVLSQIATYLSSDIPDQLQIDEARKNTQLWGSINPTDDQTDLLAFSYLVAINLNKEGAKQFRFNTISRRGTIIFNDGFVNGERKKFSYPES